MRKNTNPESTGSFMIAILLFTPLTFLQIDVSQFLTPSFHPTFVGVLRILADQDTEVKQQRAFKRFVRDYGTHYVSSAFLGMCNTETFKYFEYFYASLKNVFGVFLNKVNCNF